MTTAATAAVSEISPQQVAEFLAQNPTYFLKHEHLLADLYLPHATGEAVSLLERQVGILRERNIDMRKRLNEMLEQGQRNDALFLKTKALILDLLDAKSLNDLSAKLQQFCSQEFQLERVQFTVLANDKTHSTSQAQVLVQKDVQHVMPSLLQSQESISGSFREQELKLLFASQYQGVQSAIVQPVVVAGQVSGFIALGSFDKNYFKAGMDTLFLAFIGDVVAKLLPRFI